MTGLKTGRAMMTNAKPLTSAAIAARWSKVRTVLAGQHPARWRYFRQQIKLNL
jgi:hypothetical protein